jgi:hypothetical protein
MVIILQLYALISRLFHKCFEGMAGSLDYSELSAIVRFIITQEKILGRDYEMPDILVETGTYQGQTPKRLSCYFGKIYTIEADPLHFEQIANVLPENVCSLFGESQIILRQLVPMIQHPCVFYLDAHWWDNGNITSAELKGKTALLDELDVVGPRLFDDLIIIDDSRLFESVTAEAGDWSLITVDRILEKIKHVKLFFEKEDRFIVHKQVQI